MFQGMNFLERQEYARALASFEKAAAEQRDAGSLAYAATASYKAGDLARAQRYVDEADKLERKGYFALRIAGYKALVLFAKNEKTAGFEALKEYIELYSHLYPLRTISMEQEMLENRKVELVLLEVLVDDQATKYEDEVGQWKKTLTGFSERAP